jgi:RNA polymerase sigma-70 factor (ECF subfamily)
MVEDSPAWPQLVFQIHEGRGSLRAVPVLSAWQCTECSGAYFRTALAGRSKESIRKKLQRDAGCIGPTTVESSAVFEMYAPDDRIYNLKTVEQVYERLGNDADAEEAVQEAMLKAFKHLGSFRQESKFSTWLIQIAVNEARMKLRKDRRHLYQSIENGQRNEEGDYVPTDIADWRNIPSDALEKRELRDLLNQALKSLDEKHRTVLIMRDVDQMSIAETAQILGISEQNVKTRTSRARLRIRDLLAPAWASARGNI